MERWPFYRKKYWLSFHMCLTCHFACISVFAAPADKPIVFQIGFEDEEFTSRTE